MESPFKADVVKGKVALITGGGSGIGFEISTQFGKHGASIAIMGRRKQVLDSAVSALRSLGIQVYSVFQALSFCVSSSGLSFLALGLFDCSETWGKWNRHTSVLAHFGSLCFLFDQWTTLVIGWWENWGNLLNFPLCFNSPSGIFFVFVSWACLVADKWGKWNRFFFVQEIKIVVLLGWWKKLVNFWISFRSLIYTLMPRNCKC